MMESDNVNVLDKTPEQIFNELTANMDLKTKYGYFKEMHNVIFSVKNSPWNIVRFLYTIFSVYYPSQQQIVNINSNYDILCTGKELYTITPNSPEYKKIPKYLHGVINKRENIAKILIFENEFIGQAQDLPLQNYKIILSFKLQFF